MTLIEAVVWLVGIITTGVTIRYTAGAFAIANKTLQEIRWDFRKIIETLDDERHERQMQKEEGSDENQNDSEGR